MGMPPFPQPVAAPQFPEGAAWRRADLNKWIIGGGAAWAMLQGRAKHLHVNEGVEDYIMSDVDDAYARANEAIGKALDAYNKTITAFRSTIKNDLANISASAERMRNMTAGISRESTAAIAVMTSPEMIKALENAERLAAALKAISELQSHSITFAVLDRKPTT